MQRSQSGHRIVGSDGDPDRAKLFVLGERPGFEEVRAGRPFVGPAGDELWERLYRICGLERDDCYVANLVRTFSKDPPTDAEVDEFWPDVLADFYRVRPRVILTVGYHAARKLLQLPKETTGDAFHGLVFNYEYGRFPKRSALLVPSCHSSAALRQPGIYQPQLTEDLRVLADVLCGRRVARVPTAPVVAHVGLATTISDAARSRDGILGLDSEGRIDWPWTAECLTLAGADDRASLVETFAKGPTTPALPHAQAAIDKADRIAIHNAMHDVKAAGSVGLDLPWSKVDDTMVMAYALNLPKGLKELQLRLFGWQMHDYEDLIQPLDDDVVRKALEHGRERILEAIGPTTQRKAGESAGDARSHSCGTAAQHAATSEQPAAGDDRAAQGRTQSRRHPRDRRRRAVTSINGILAKTAQETCRVRWSKSKFADLVDLPNVPTWKDLPQGTRADYALTDAVGHRVLRNALARRLDDEGLRRIYRLDMSVLPWLNRNEEVGLGCDPRKLRALSRLFSDEHRRTCARIDDLAGFPVNPHSGEQVADVLFNELGIEPTRLTPSKKHYTTADKYLKARRNEHAIVPLILFARQLKKYQSTYTDKLPGMLVCHGRNDWRYHPDWGYTVAATGRLVETIILLIPKHDPTSRDEHGQQWRPDYAKAIRDCFHARDGHTLISCDLSQIELRAMAHLSRDERLLYAFAHGIDIHAQVAHELLGAPKAKDAQDESKHRLPAKTINFGIINGMTEYGMLDQLHEAGQLQWTIDDVQDLLAEWFKLHKGVDAYWDEQIRKARRLGYVETMHGRRRHVYGLISTEPRIVREAERQCLAPIQGTADEISKVWNRRMWTNIIEDSPFYCEPWIRVHDDTTLEADERQAPAVGKRMLDLVPDLLCVPTTAEVKVGHEWGSLAKLKKAA